MKAWIGAVALVGTLASGNAIADGNELLRQCQATVREMSDGSTGTWSYDAGYCIGRVASLLDMLNGYGKLLPANLKVCMPKEKVSYGQGVRIVIKFLEAHPDVLHNGETALMQIAFRLAFPCKD